MTRQVVTAAAQLPLDLGHRPAMGGLDFLVAPCNEQAVAWLDRWPDWPSPALVVHGPEGCGKTHLTHVWQVSSGAISLSAESLAAADPPALVGDAAACIIDNADAGIDERALLHLYNFMAERGGRLLLTGRAPPARWPLVLADLASRLRAAAAVAIGAPDDALIGGVLVKLFADRQLRVAPSVITYLLSHIERSFAAARRIVSLLDEAALAEKRRITMPLARDVLRRLEQTSQGSEDRWTPD